MTVPLPQLAHPSKGGLPTDGRWTMEPKLDGWRLTIWVTAEGRVRIFGGRNGAEFTGSAPGIEAAIAAMDLPADTILDGEIILEGEHATSVPSYLAGNMPGAWARAYLWDVLRHGGRDVTGEPWTERRRILEDLAEGFDRDHVCLVPSVEPDPDLYQAWLDAGLEGAVCKRRDSVYRPGKRPRDWVKHKPQQTAEAIITGFRKGKAASNANEVAAFVLTLVDTGVETTCATSTDVQRAQIKREPEAFLGKTCTINHLGWRDGGVKSPTFSHMRPDRDPVPA